MPKLTIEVPDEHRAVTDLLNRAAQGDRAAAAEFCRRMDADPTGELVRIAGGDLAELAERSLAVTMGGDNLACREAVRKKLEMLRAELGGPDPTPIERLLVERAVLCWAEVHKADILATDHGGGRTYRDLEHHERRRDRAHRRYLASLKALALVRRLRPTEPVRIEINQTVHVAAPAAAKGQPASTVVADLLNSRVSCAN